jgi:hypothetical protein
MSLNCSAKAPRQLPNYSELYVALKPLMGPQSVWTSWPSPCRRQWTSYMRSVCPQANRSHVDPKTQQNIPLFMPWNTELLSSKKIRTSAFCCDSATERRNNRPRDHTEQRNRWAKFLELPEFEAAYAERRRRNLHTDLVGWDWVKRH